MLEERIAADLELGADAELVAEIEALVRSHPLRERLRANLMLALYQCGRQAEALAAFHDARRTLIEELGIEPGPELQALYGSILRQERVLIRVAQPALEDHYDEVMRAFAAGRLVPVLGPGVGGVAGHELAALLAARFELDVERPRPRLRLAGGRGAQRDRPAARRAPPRARARLRAVASPRTGSPACRRCSAAARCRSS